MVKKSIYTTSCKTIHGFTLIELLVVIAIIGLLLSIVLPSLKVAKQTAQGVVCATNQKTLCNSWILYYEENDGYFVGADAWGTGKNAPPSLQWAKYVPSETELWCQAPQIVDGVMVDQANGFAAATFEDEKRGIVRGALYPYVDETKVYHCPGDLREKMYPNTGGLYRTYSIVGGVNGQHDLNRFLEITRANQLKIPSEKYIMVEEAGKVWNQGSWVISPLEQGWIDKTAMWHHKRVSLGFADGHAAIQKWRDKRTIEFLETETNFGLVRQNFINPNPDLDYMLRHFPHLGNCGN